MALTDNIVAAFLLDNDEVDATGNGHDGTVSNGPITYAAGANGQAATGVIGSPATNSPRINLAGFGALLAWTVTARVKLFNYTTLNSAGGTILGSAANSRGVTITNAGLLNYYVGGNHNGSGVPPTIPLNTWTPVAVSYDGTKLRFYVDGVFTGDETIDLPSTLGTLTPAYLLSATGGFWAAPLDGLIDDVCIFDVAKPDADITAIAAAGPYPFAAPAVPVVVTSVDPASGPAAGGTAITVEGSGFEGSDAGAATTVSLDGTPCTSVVIVSDTELTCVTPAHAAGAADLTVTNNDAESDSLTLGFTFDAPPAPPPTSDYGTHLQNLLPPGKLWNLEPDSRLHRLLVGMGDEFARVEARGATLLEESDPRTATETIGDWERVLALPDALVTTISAVLAERRIAVTQKLVGRSGQNLAFYAALCNACGYPFISITRYADAVLRAGFRVGRRCYGYRWAYAMTLSVTNAGYLDRLTTDQFEAVIRHVTQTHIEVTFIYV